MRLRYKWLTVLLLALCCGCQAHRAKAEVKEVTIYDVAAMVEEKQSFVVVLTQSMCSSCKDFKTMLSTWAITGYDSLCRKAGGGSTARGNCKGAVS